jgi:hypothetical protein
MRQTFLPTIQLQALVEVLAAAAAGHPEFAHGSSFHEGIRQKTALT